MTRVELSVEFAKLAPEAKMPTQGSSEAAGWDLYAMEETTVVRHKSSLIRTGLATAAHTLGTLEEPISLAQRRKGLTQ